MSQSIRIYCPNPTSRHEYIFSLVFKELLGVDYVFTSSVADCDLNYSPESGGTFRIVPQGLLAEHDIRDNIRIQFSAWEKTVCFFSTTGDIPFDIFSAAFYLVSRYDEYLSYESDAHHRFPAESCVHFNYLEEPLVNVWVLKLKDALMVKDSKLTFKVRSFSFRSTLDIDQAWKYKHKGIVRNTLGIIRDLTSLQIDLVKERIVVLLGSRPDPFYNFEWQKKVHETYDTPAHYFILLGDYGTYDKNTKHTLKPFRQLIQDLSHNERNIVGIHPSYQSNVSAEQVSCEMGRLSDILKTEITHSRQHFLMHSMPQTYQTLIDNGITEEHTMGFSTHIGFRAGIAAPFYWFDLSKNKATKLKLVPFCVMDITPLNYLQLCPEEAVDRIAALQDRVKKVGGLFVSLWHNESLSESGRWKGWRIVYQKMVEHAQILAQKKPA